MNSSRVVGPARVFDLRDVAPNTPIDGYGVAGNEGATLDRLCSSYAATKELRREMGRVAFHLRKRKRRLGRAADAHPPMKAEALFYLGFANYKMEKPQEAANFYKACAAIKGPLQATAAKNLQGIKTQFRGIQ